jgi:2-iminobutanoate/2-iminopropanoate deaminase
MEIIDNNLIPKANGHYSTAIKSNGILYVSGQLPISTDGSHHPDKNFEEQFEMVFQNIVTILEASGSSLEKVVKVTVYITDVQLWPKFNSLYAHFMGNHKPVRTVVPVSQLHYGYKLEVDLIAEI